MDLSKITEHEAAVTNCVRAAIRDGYRDFHAVLLRCKGADPTLVQRLYTALGGQTFSSNAVPLAQEPSNTLLPAADPSLSQFWFSSATVFDIRRRVHDMAAGTETPRVLCLGAPSLAEALIGAGCAVTLLDLDSDLCAKPYAMPFDAVDPLPKNLEGQFDVAVTDPPWYDPHIFVFANRCLQALKLGGSMLITFPALLTKPGVDELRARFLNGLIKSGQEIDAVEPAGLQYQVPNFETASFRHVDGFRGTPWRRGDLIQITKKTEQHLATSVELQRTTREAYCRSAGEFRVFLNGAQSCSSADTIEIDPQYAKSVSTRNLRVPDIWSTEKVGAAIGNVALVRAALQLWASGSSREQTLTALDADYLQDSARAIIRQLDESFELWTRFGAEKPLRTDKQIQDARQAAVEAWATNPTAREHQEQTDGFRAPYQRDRDRILWSAGVRRLSNKTQLFPVEHDDDLRQRLAHSVEVLQIASTIGTSFGLDNDLIEAGALAHDIGHTPFGHAGEYALDKLCKLVNLRGFNHYEHGVDVLRYLEGPYHVSSVSQFSGLNLTPELCECVIKHTYCHGGDSGSEEILAQSKHAGFIGKGRCHLEGQAVRIADKISYLISDLEDGIRLGAITQLDLLGCRFFHRPPLHFDGDTGEPLSQRFANQRRHVLKLLIEDILRASNQKLTRLTDKSVEGVRSAVEYVIDYSAEMDEDVTEIWRKIQAGRLHKDRRVVGANLQAARIVSELTILFSLMPELVEERFHAEYERLHSSPYMQHYRAQTARVELMPALIAFAPLHVMIGKKHEIGQPARVDIQDFIRAKDYVAALTDTRARLFHRRLIDG